MKIEIGRAVPDDAGIILGLQKKCFLKEAELYNDPTIPPLTETVDDLLKEFARSVILKATVENRIIGTVRGNVTDEGNCYIGRLAVSPEYRNQGIGTRLMLEIEKIFADREIFELMTGDKSSDNIRLYEKLEYRIAGTKNITEKVKAVQMIKDKKINRKITAKEALNG